jgi:hypothetical protein
MVKKKKDSQEIATTAEPIAIETTTCEDNLRANLEEIKRYHGVVGYILRNATSASIDLKDPARIIDYAILSSTAFDATEGLSELFDLRGIKDIVVTGKNLKMLSITVEGNKISIFMENDADTEKVLQRIQTS